MRSEIIGKHRPVATVSNSQSQWRLCGAHSVGEKWNTKTRKVEKKMRNWVRVKQKKES